jgi:hypothetical protein
MNRPNISPFVRTFEYVPFSMAYFTGKDMVGNIYPWGFLRLARIEFKL